MQGPVFWHLELGITLIVIVRGPLRSPLLVREEKLLSACTPLLRPCSTLVRLQVATPSFLTFVFSGLGSLAPKFIVPLPPRCLLPEGVKTHYTVLTNSRNTLVQIKHPPTLRPRPNPPVLPFTVSIAEPAKKSPYAMYFSAGKCARWNETWNT